MLRVSGTQRRCVLRYILAEQHHDHAMRLTTVMSHKTQVGRVRAVLGGKGAHQKERLAMQGVKASASDYEFIMVR